MVEWSFTNLVVVGANPVAVSLFVLEKPRFFIVYLTVFGWLSQGCWLIRFIPLLISRLFLRSLGDPPQLRRLFPGESFTFEL